MPIRGTCSATCRRLSMLLLLGHLLQPMQSQANEFRQGLDAYLDGDYETALALWNPLATQGHAAAQYSLGTLYESGRGVSPDYPQAARWFRLAAEQGHAAAQFSLGNAYHRGHGVNRDARQAERWWRKAASQDFAAAQVSLDKLYQSSQGIRRNEANAQESYRRAAKNGSRSAQQRVDEQRLSMPRPASRPQPSSARTAAQQTTVQAVSAEEPGIKREAWLLRQEPNHYALQLTASGNEHNIRAFIDRHKLSSKAAYYKSLRAGDDWYCLLYGTYPDYDQARQALAALPNPLRDSEPWIRPLSSVQKSITDIQYALSE